MFDVDSLTLARAIARTLAEPSLRLADAVRDELFTALLDAGQYAAAARLVGAP